MDKRLIKSPTSSISQISWSDSVLKYQGRSISIFSVLFCSRCSFNMLAWAIFSSRGAAYINTGLMHDLYSRSLFVGFNLDFRHNSGYNFRIVTCAFWITYSTCFAKVRRLSNTTPRYFASELHSICLLFTMNGVEGNSWLQSVHQFFQYLC